jgi:putative transposase
VNLAVTVKLYPSGRWHISIRFDDPNVKRLPVSDKVIEIDLGISSFMITNDGGKVANPKQFKKHYRRVRKAQKSLSRKHKRSNNREKARIKVALIHAQITDSTKDHLHKLTTQLVRENQTILLENLAVKNLSITPN